MKNIKIKTFKNQLLKICFLQSLIFYALTIFVLVSFVAFIPKINGKGWGVFYYIIVAPSYLGWVLLLLISKIPLIKIFKTTKLKIWYLFTFYIFYFKLKNIEIAKTDYYKRLNLGILLFWLFCWVILNIIFLSLLLSKIEEILMFYLFNLPILLVTLVPTFINWYFLRN